MTDAASRSAPRRSPVRRPATARLRSDGPADPGSVAIPSGAGRALGAPTHDELALIERSQSELLAQSVEDIVDEPQLGVVWVRAPWRTGGLVATCVRWSDADADALVAHVERRARDEGEWPAISLADGLTQPLDLAARLAAAGWARTTSERVMYTRHAPIVPHLDPGVRIEAATRLTALDVVRLEVANFGLPADEVGGRAERLAVAVAAGSVRGYLVRAVREPVASARLVPAKAIAAVTGVGVAARHRGRGYGRLVTAVATRAGLATGHPLVWLSVDESNEPAVNLYRSLGYEPSFGWSRWIAPAR